MRLKYMRKGRATLAAILLAIPTGIGAP